MAQRPSIHINERLRKLLQSIRKEGIVAVVQRDDLDHVDRSLLNLLMGFKRAFNGSETAIKSIKKDSFTSQTMRYSLQSLQDPTTTETKD
jgi:hypothetical protein